jgi:hypothetical protein
MGQIERNREARWPSLALVSYQVRNPGVTHPLDGNDSTEDIEVVTQGSFLSSFHNGQCLLFAEFCRSGERPVPPPLTVVRRLSFSERRLQGVTPFLSDSRVCRPSIGKQGHRTKQRAQLMHATMMMGIEKREHGSISLFLGDFFRDFVEIGFGWSGASSAGCVNVQRCRPFIHFFIEEVQKLGQL